MLIPTIIMGIAASILLLIGYCKGLHLNGIKAGFSMVLEILPLLFFAFIIAGMVKTLMPHQLLSRLIGEESGLRGVFIGAIAGAMTPGGPYTSMPIIAGLLRSGASIGTMVSFITGWSLLAIGRLPIEIGILGWRFALIRFLSVFFFAPIAGLIAQGLVKIIKLQ